MSRTINRVAVPTEVGLSKNSTGESVIELQKFLGKFGYLEAVSEVAEAVTYEGIFDDSTEKALLKYQEFHGLSQTGKLDEATIEQMSLRRCGVKDPVGNFTAQGNKWDKTDLTYRFVNFTPELTEQEIRSAITTALSLWSTVTPLTFTEVTGNADILISFVTGDHGDGNPFDGVGNVLAHAYYPPPNGGDIAGDAHFDDSETWSVNLPPSGTDLVTVAAHEFGHSLGLDHSTVHGALMFPTYSGPQRFLHQDDIGGIQSIYGRKLGWQPWFLIHPEVKFQLGATVTTLVPRK
ncbi:matrixin family metalloprotease, partial [Brevibacillus laterosporus]|uniref:matrixin family metalloprotease n=1 Tax=Brevibacillus laterosporus TaxID=1465 RepID=UPI0009D9B0BA